MALGIRLDCILLSRGKASLHHQPNLRVYTTVKYAHESIHTIHTVWLHLFNLPTLNNILSEWNKLSFLYSSDLTKRRVCSRFRSVRRVYLCWPMYVWVEESISIYIYIYVSLCTCELIRLFKHDLSFQSSSLDSKDPNKSLLLREYSLRIIPFVFN